MLFVKFYDINTKAVDWKSITDDWQKLSNGLTWANVKLHLESINGFKYSLERSTPMGLEKPHLYYLQIVGRREELSQLDIATMQNSRERIESSPFYRTVGTYDFMIEKFRPLIN